jgi:putative SOS response-associated peptidase YedK
LKSDGRNFPRDRCLVIADGFYEYTLPADPKQKRKDRWLFTPSGGSLLGIAGLVRTHPVVGEAFTMLTAEPGPDVAPYHRRQIVLVPPGDWARWLDPEIPSSELLRPTEAGFLQVERA